MSRWESWHIQGHTLEYEEDSHSYICDGIEIPSVTQLLRLKSADKYAGIPRHILDNAARIGTMLHSTIEEAEKSGNADKYELSPDREEIANEFESYLYLKKKYRFCVEKSELPLLIPCRGEIVAAGRMDMLLTDGDGRIGIADIKRTYRLDEEYVARQLALYSFGVEYSYNVVPEFFACVWLRKDQRKYVILPQSRKEEMAALLRSVWDETQR